MEQEEKLQDQQLSSLATDRLIAELYLQNNLRLDAIKIMEPLTDNYDYASNRLFLGKVYLEIGLLNEAKFNFEQALYLSNMANEIEVKVDAYTGLGIIDLILNDKGYNNQYFLHALSLYEQMGDEEGINRLNDLIGQ